jgi:hypothetical protein
MAEFRPVAWFEAHPVAGGAILFGGGLGLLWLFGFFGSSSSSASSSNTAATNMAAAYYGAEAQQAVVGGQMQIASEQFAAQTAQTGLQANAAVAINQANATASQNIASSMYNSATQINAANTNAAVQLGSVQANDASQLASVQANDALAATASNNAYAYLTNVAGNAANQNITAMQTIIPQELALTGGTSFNMNYGGQDYNLSSFAPPPNTPAYAAYAGYTPAQVAGMF